MVVRDALGIVREVQVVEGAVGVPLSPSGWAPVLSLRNQSWKTKAGHVKAVRALLFWSHCSFTAQGEKATRQRWNNKGVIRVVLKTPLRLNRTSARSTVCSHLHDCKQANDIVFPVLSLRLLRVFN